MISSNPAPLFPSRCFSKGPDAPALPLPDLTSFSTEDSLKFSSTALLGSWSTSKSRRAWSGVVRSNTLSHPSDFLLLRNITSATAHPGRTRTINVLSSSHVTSLFSKTSSLDSFEGEGGASSFPFGEEGLLNRRDCRGADNLAFFALGLDVAGWATIFILSLLLNLQSGSSSQGSPSSSAKPGAKKFMVSSPCSLPHSCPSSILDDLVEELCPFSLGGGDPPPLTLLSCLFLSYFMSESPHSLSIIRSWRSSSNPFITPHVGLKASAPSAPHSHSFLGGLALKAELLEDSSTPPRFLVLPRA